MNILFKLSGSIACYKACDLISRLTKAGHDVQAVTTAGAERFIGTSTLEGLTGRPVLDDLWQTGDQMAHIRLPEWADLTILCPASASAINRLASGDASDLMGTLFLAHDFAKPYFVAPAMNTRMLNHPATVAALDKLASWGVHTLPTDEGDLACKDVGAGKLLDPAVIFDTIMASVCSAQADSLRILITAGGTEEPIDSVRVISNLSTGRTGSFLADDFARRGARVTLLKARRAAAPASTGVEQHEFTTAKDLETLLRQHLQEKDIDLVVHAAAVSDFTLDHGLDSPETLNKIDSSKPLQLPLKPAPKLLPQIKSWAASSSEPVVVGFKLTDTLVSAEPGDDTHPVRVMLASGNVDAVLHNAREVIGDRSGKHPGCLYFADGRHVDCQTKAELAAALWELAQRARGGRE